MLSSSLNWLSVGQAGVITLDIPVYTLGQGRPVMGITCSIHGDEIAGLFVVAKVIDYLKATDSLNGTVHIIPVANPAAQFVGNRGSHLDFKDLNRVGQGNKSGSISERIGARLFDFLSQCDLVVNLHNFEMDMPVTATYINVGSSEIKSRTLAAIKAFSPELIWVIDQSKDNDVQYQTILDNALAVNGVISCPIEMSPLESLTESHLQTIVKGILNMIAHLGIIKPSLNEDNINIPVVTRHEFTSDRGGLWQPCVSLLQTIQAGDKMGVLTSLPDFEPRNVYAPLSGLLIQCRRRQLVATGTSIFSLGLDANHII